MTALQRIAWVWMRPNRYGDRPFDDVESDMEHDYSTLRGQSRLEWEDAKHATRAAWDRIEG
jgi:hypothetical protein